MVHLLKVGDDAPQFSLSDVNDNKIVLNNFKKSYVLIAFLRYAGCPWCNLAIHRLAVEMPLLKDSRCEVIAFLQATQQEVMTEIVNRHAITPPFPIIADKKMKTYSRYEVRPALKLGLKHHIEHIPSWVKSVAKDGLRNQKVDRNYFLAPAMFLVSPETQQIISVSYTADLYSHETFSSIYDAIANHTLHPEELLRK